MNTHKQQYYFDTFLNKFKDLIKHEVNLGNIKSFDEVYANVEALTGIEFIEGDGYKQHILSWYQELINLAFLYPLLEIQQEDLEEMIVMGAQQCFCIARLERQMFEVNYQAMQAHEYQLALEIFALKNQQSWNYNNPFVSFNTQLNGQHFRATLVHACLTPDERSKIFLRKNRPQTFIMSDYTSAEQLDFFKQAIAQHKNIVVCGSTGSGKTSFLKTLLDEVSPQDHVIVLEDCTELGISPRHTHTHMLSHPAHPDKTLKQYCSYALRMRPDRIVLGEIRSSEIIPFILALNSGHKGAMCSLHANSAQEAVERMATLFCLYSGQETIQYQQVLKLICSNVDYIVHMDNKKIKGIIQILGLEQNRPLFETIYPDQEEYDSNNKRSWQTSINSTLSIS